MPISYFSPSRWLAVALAFALGIFGQAARAQDSDLSFDRDIRGILADNCFACHGPDSQTREADLRLDDRENAIDMEAIVPNEPDESELVARIFSDDPDLLMPPPDSKKSLTDAQKKTLRQWIEEGAPFETHWAFVAPEKSPLPEVANASWTKNPIDRFVLAQLEARGLRPAPEVDPRTLIRRVHLDITGLLPSVEDVERFAIEYPQRGDKALSEWIDRLMERPAWGEHRARYWLDAARYGDTHGMHFDNYREMWPYRDWVIRAFNANQPFDQFVVEQLAGDLLPNPTLEQRIATGFQRCNITTNEGGTIEEENLALYASDRVQTFGWVFLGLTTNCAQCHDHKFDPFTRKDYYSLAAFFRNTTQGGLDGNSKDGRSAIVYLPSDEDLPRWNALPGEIETARAAVEARRAAATVEAQTWLTQLAEQPEGLPVPTDALVFHALLNEGPDRELLAQGKDASFVLPTNGKLDWSLGEKFGPAPKFAKDRTAVVGDIGAWNMNDAFSYGGWIKAPNRNSSGGIIARMDEANNYRGWDLWLNNGGYAVHLVDKWPDNSIKVETRNNAVEPGKWQHVFVTYDGSARPEGIKIYLDGKPEALTTSNHTLQPAASLQTDTPTRIGQRSGDQVFRGGMAQDVRLYERALDEAEVAALAANGFIRSLLATEAETRTPEQTAALVEHYLRHVDPVFPGLAKKVSQLEEEQRKIRERSPITHVQEERMNSDPMAFILTRGEYDRHESEVHAATPAVLPPLKAGEPGNRLGLAHWLVEEQHPLLARVTVNRIWQQIFGQGIVVTAEDFGVMGAPPSHPELLDWLAVDFRENGWDVKQFFKSILMSATYRQAAVATSEKLELDPQNTLLSRGPRFRMDAEMVRDAALTASGLLSNKMYGPSVKPYQPEAIWDVVGLPEGNTRRYEQSHGEDLYRRSLYTFWKRMAPPPTLESFNAPSREVCTVRRERTNTPLQALVTLNDPTFFEAARVLAQDVLKYSGIRVDPETGEVIGDSGRDTHWQSTALNAMALRTLARTFTDEEQRVLQSDLGAFLDHYTENPSDAEKVLKTGESPAPNDLPPVTLAAWTLLANELLNLDEFLSK